MKTKDKIPNLKNCKSNKIKNSNKWSYTIAAFQLIKKKKNKSLTFGKIEAHREGQILTVSQRNL